MENVSVEDKGDRDGVRVAATEATANTICSLCLIDIIFS